MSVTGFWFVEVVSDAKVAALADLPHLAAVAKSDARNAAAWKAWLAEPEAVGPHVSDEAGRLRLTPASSDFLELFWTMPWRDSSWSAGAGGEPAEADLGHIAIRKLPPVSLLFVGLGPRRARLLPGFLGDFLLTARELVAAHESLNTAFDLSPDERARAIARMRGWVYWGEPKADVESCLDLLPRMAARALESQRGLCSISLRF